MHTSSGILEALQTTLAPGVVVWAGDFVDVWGGGADPG